MVDQRSHVVYRRLLLSTGHGYPFWVPEPDQSLPIEYRNRGIRIGDVGLLTEDGGFDFLFNIHHEGSHPINGGRVPPGFQPLPLADDELPIREILHMHKAKSTITSGQVSKRALTLEASADLAPFAVGGGFGFEFSVLKAEAAILMLPDGATRYVAKSRATYSKYAKENGVSLYQYVNDALRRETPNGSLYIITGCDKCRSWATAAVSQPEDKHEISLKFIAGGLAQGTMAVHTSSSLDCGVETRSYPPDQGSPSSLEENQCVFARGITVVIRENRIASKVLGAVQLSYISGSSKDCDWNASPSGSWAPFSSSASSSSSRFSSSLSSINGQSRCSTAFLGIPSDNSSEKSLGDELINLVADVHDFPQYATTVLNPALYIGEHILSMCPFAELAVIEDETWMSAVSSNDSETTIDFPGLLQAVLQQNTVEEVDGIVTVRELDGQLGLPLPESHQSPLIKEVPASVSLIKHKPVMYHDIPTSTTLTTPPHEQVEDEDKPSTEQSLPENPRAFVGLKGFLRSVLKLRGADKNINVTPTAPSRPHLLSKLKLGRFMKTMRKSDVNVNIEHSHFRTVSENSDSTCVDEGRGVLLSNFGSADPWTRALAPVDPPSVGRVRRRVEGVATSDDNPGKMMNWGKET